MPELKVDFVPARRWEAASCIRLILETVRDRDPWANRILARPWSLFSLVRYAYLLDNFIHSDTFFVVVSGERAGHHFHATPDRVSLSRHCGPVAQVSAEQCWPAYGRVYPGLWRT